MPKKEFFEKFKYEVNLISFSTVIQFTSLQFEVIFLKLSKFQSIKEGDNIAILNTGAYGMSLSSNYNVRPMPIEILIKNKKSSVILKRQKLNEIT